MADALGAGNESRPSGRGVNEKLLARARYERERACLDLADAEQADLPSGTVRARELYACADRHRALAARLEAGDSSALIESSQLQEERHED